MPTGFPLLWLLVALPFVSSIVIVLTPGLQTLCASRTRITWPIGVLGLGLLFSGLIGLLPTAAALPLMLLGGAVSGFSMFWPAPRDTDSDDGDDWRRRPPPEEPPPPVPEGDGPIDWQLFDRLRADWEARPATRGAPSPGWDD